MSLGKRRGDKSRREAARRTEKEEDGNVQTGLQTAQKELT